MNIQDYLMDEKDKAKLLAKLEQDIGLEDERDALSYEGEVNNSNNEVDDESDLF